MANVTAYPIIDFDVWPPGIDQAATPANRNALRAEIIAKPALSFEASKPGSPADGDLYVLSASWGDTYLDPDNDPVDPEGLLAYYRDGAWTYWEPFLGQIKRIGVVFYEYQPDSSGEWYGLFNDAGDYADDAAAASGGVEVGQLYRTGSALKVRIA